MKDTKELDLSYTYILTFSQPQWGYLITVLISTLKTFRFNFAIRRKTLTYYLYCNIKDLYSNIQWHRYRTSYSILMKSINDLRGF